MPAPQLYEIFGGEIISHLLVLCDVQIGCWEGLGELTRVTRGIMTWGLKHAVCYETSGSCHLLCPYTRGADGALVMPAG